MSNLIIKYVLVLEKEGWGREEVFETSEAMLARVKELDILEVKTDQTAAPATPAAPEPPAA